VVGGEIKRLGGSKKMGYEKKARTRNSFEEPRKPEKRGVKLSSAVHRRKNTSLQSRKDGRTKCAEKK